MCESAAADQQWRIILFGFLMYYREKLCCAYALKDLVTFFESQLLPRLAPKAPCLVR